MGLPNRFLIFLFLLGPGSLSAQELWTIGPMLHVNFGVEKRTTSFAIEVAYWNLKSFYYSIDGAIEFDRHRIRLYSELQTGIGLTGISLGPVFEVNTKEGKFHAGIQGSAWINYILGVDYRIRWINKTNYQCFGGYVKLPIAQSGLDTDGDGDGLDDWDDWD